MKDNNSNSERLATSTRHESTPPQLAIEIPPKLKNDGVGENDAASTTNHQTSSTIPLQTRMILSAFAGMGAATVCHPLDVIRVQMQTYHFKNSWEAATSIYQRAGLQNGLYAGISAAYLRQWLYGSCRMGIYSYLLERAKNQNASSGAGISFAQKLLMGMISGSIGSFVGTPSEVALVRMSADSKQPANQRRNYTSVFNCLGRIAKEEGIQNLWRGATPTVLRATLLSSCQMGITSEVKGRLSQSGFFGENGMWLGGYPMLFCSTLVSSFCANVVANPFDVLKSRLQNMAIAADGTAPYSSMVDCLVKSLRSEGPMVLWAGFTPAFIKLAPYTVISLTLADKLSRAVTGKDAL